MSVPEPHGTNRVGGLLLVAAAATVWSVGGLIVRSLEVTDSWTISFWRSVFALLVVTGFVLARERNRTVTAFRDVGWPGIVVGACFATASLAFVVALGLTSVANTLVILATTPFVAALLGRWFLGEMVRSQTWLAMAVSLAGIILMVRGSVGAGSLRGDLVAFLTPFAFATATVIIRKHREVSMTPAMAIGPFLGLAVSALLAGGFAVSGGDLVLLAVFGGIQLGTGMAIFAVGARMAPAAEVALVSLLETVLGPLWVWLFADESPSRSALIGGMLVLGALAGSAALDLGMRRRR